MEREEAEVSIPLREPLTPGSEEYYRSIFNRADKDHDDHITFSELQEMIRRNSVTRDLPEKVVNGIHQASDVDKDGRLSFDEFVEMLNNPQYKNVFGVYVNKYINFIVARKRLAQGLDEGDGRLYEDEYTCCPPKIGMIIISLIEVIFFLIDEIREANSTTFATGPMAQTFIYDPARRREAWRYLTYMFVHIGYFHLTINLVIQIFIGIPLEMVHRWWRVLLIYFAGVIAGSLGTSITDPTAKLAGASGGVYSLITAHIATIILNWKQMSFPGVQLIIFLLITGVDVGTSIYNRYWANLDEQIGYAAHFAGAIAGLLVGISVLRNLEWTKKEKVIWWIAAITYGVLMLIAICWNIFGGDYFPKQI